MDFEVRSDPATWERGIAVIGIGHSEPYAHDPCPNDQTQGPAAIRAQSGQFGFGGGQHSARDTHMGQQGGAYGGGQMGGHMGGQMGSQGGDYGGSTGWQSGGHGASHDSGSNYGFPGPSQAGQGSGMGFHSAGGSSGLGGSSGIGGGFC